MLIFCSECHIKLNRQRRRACRVAAILIENHCPLGKGGGGHIHFRIDSPFHIWLFILLTLIITEVTCQSLRFKPVYVSRGETVLVGPGGGDAHYNFSLIIGLYAFHIELSFLDPYGCIAFLREYSR